jgi:hypothetical protein
MRTTLIVLAALAATVPVVLLVAEQRWRAGVAAVVARLNAGRTAGTRAVAVGWVFSGSAESHWAGAPQPRRPR